MVFAAFVTRPCLCEINTQLLSALDNLRFREPNERTQNLHAAVRAETNCGGHGVHEFSTAVGKDGVVSRVRGDDDGVRADGFRKARRRCEEDTVAKRDDGLLHGQSFVVCVRDAWPGLQQRRAEMLANEIQADDFVADAEPLAMMRRKRNLPMIVFRPVIEAESGDDFIVRRRFVERADGIQTTADQDDGFTSHGFVFTSVRSRAAVAMAWPRFGG